MASRQPPGSQKAGRQSKAGGHGRGPSVSQSGGSTLEDYLHVVTDAAAALLIREGGPCPLQEIKQKTGADVQLDPHPTPGLDTKPFIIRGSRLQIEAAVRLINQKTGAQENISTQAQTFWLQWVEDSFSDLDSRAYFLPPVYINRVPMVRQSLSGQDLLVLRSPLGQAGHLTIYPFGATQPSIPQPPTVQDSDVRDDAAMQRVLFCLQKMSEENKEVLVGMSQLQFGQYLGEPCYAAAAAQLPLSSSLPPALPRNWKQGDFDVLLIHRHCGLITCEVKSFGHNVNELKMPQEEVKKNIRKKLKVAVSQLDKAEAMLSHLVSDIAPGLRITKMIAVPNLTALQVQQAISSDPQLTQGLCRCLGTKDPIDISGLCLCSDQLSSPKTPWDVSSHVLEELSNWWQRRVAGAGPDSHMTCDVYKKLVARFCGPATTVTVPCRSPPRVCIKTLGQAVSHTGECYTAEITLFPEQVHLLNMAPPRLFVAGPPGTGKSVVLLLMGTQWLRCGEDVLIVSVGDWSRAACTMLYHLLLQTVNTQQTAGLSPGQPYLLQYDTESLEMAAEHLTKAVREGSLYIIADEVGFLGSSPFPNFCAKLLTQVPRLHLWAASCFHINPPAGWQVEYLTRPLRSPPAVVREVEKDDDVGAKVKPYIERGVPDHTDGPPVKRVHHRGDGHSGDYPDECVTCGREVSSFLHSLHVGVPGNTTTTSTTVTSVSGNSTPPDLQWRDVLVLSWRNVTKTSGVMTGLSEAGIPVRVMEDADIEDVVTSRSDVVWVTDGDRVRGLERKVVVCLSATDDDSSTDRLDLMSRCTSQLVIVSLDP